MKIAGSYFSKKGRSSTNEDSVLPLKFFGEHWWAAVADGMGGHKGGAIASATAINILESEIAHNELSISNLFVAVKNELDRLSDVEPELIKMGTTLSLVKISEGTAEIGHVGDSRIYQLRNAGIVSRTIDQTEAQELIQRGVLSKATARRYPRRNILLSALTPRKSYNLVEERFDVRDGDRIVLMTDGVTAKILAREIRDLSLACKSNELFCNRLMEEIERRSPDDDYTAVCLDLTLG